jgi:CheY-like chemotaxis protein
LYAVLQINAVRRSRGERPGGDKNAARPTLEINLPMPQTTKFVGQNGSGTLPYWHNAHGSRGEIRPFQFHNCLWIKHFQIAVTFGIAPAIPKQATMHNLRNKSILIVDDDAGMLRALDKVLTGQGAAVACADCAEDAVAILTGRQKWIDLVITDLWMPFNSGTGMTVICVVHEFFPTLPVIVLTAFGSPEVKSECLRQGAMVVLVKPLDTPQLLTAVENVLAPKLAGVGQT